MKHRFSISKARGAESRTQHKNLPIILKASVAGLLFTVCFCCDSGFDERTGYPVYVSESVGFAGRGGRSLCVRVNGGSKMPGKRAIYWARFAGWLFF